MYSSYIATHCPNRHCALLDSSLSCPLLVSPISRIETYYFNEIFLEICFLFALIVRSNLQHAVCSFHHVFSSPFLYMLAYNLHDTNFQKETRYKRSTFKMKYHNLLCRYAIMSRIVFAKSQVQKILNITKTHPAHYTYRQRLTQILIAI